jgi:gluconolactonase
MSPRAAVSVALLFLPAIAMSDDASPVAPGAKLEKLAEGFKFTEGPAADAKGNVYFTDQPNDRILKYDTAGKLTTWMQPCGRSNGLCFGPDGKLWACADEKNELWAIDVETKKHTVVVKDYHGKLLNGPNDVWVRPDGGIYFTDPFYKRDYLKQPNGIIGTPDGKTLYVADIGANKTYSYSIPKDGILTGKKLFCELGSDGMTIDERGNVYLTGKGVTVFDKAGKKIAQIDVPEPWTANVCFGGSDMKTLFITASTRLYGIKTGVKGAGSQ